MRVMTGRLPGVPGGLLILLLGLAGCSSLQPGSSGGGGGGGATHREPVDSAPRPLSEPEIAAISDAVPRHEVRTRAGNANPYTVFGRTYHLLPDSRGYREEGVASWYGMKFHGRPTANGERYDVFGMTAAHRTLPIPSYVRVTNLANGRSVVVRVNDRGPFHGDRIIDLSWVAARKLGFARMGTAQVRVEAVEPGAPAPLLAHVPSEAQPASVQEPSPSAPPPAAAQAAAEAAPSPSPTAAARWFLQVGAYRDYTIAQRVHLDLGAHLPGQVSIDSARGDGFHRVRVGPLQDADTVHRVRAVLAAQQIEDPILISD